MKKLPTLHLCIYFLIPLFLSRSAGENPQTPKGTEAISLNMQWEDAEKILLSKHLEITPPPFAILASKKIEAKACRMDEETYIVFFYSESTKKLEKMATWLVPANANSVRSYIVKNISWLQITPEGFSVFFKKDLRPQEQKRKDDIDGMNELLQEQDPPKKPK